jgi:spore coat polysaccharide biosynthesis protein SpsF (cytidylyltransferase family)
VQHVKEPTRGNRILDVVLTNESNAVIRISNDPPFSTSDHNIVKFDLLFETESKVNYTYPMIRKYIWKNADYNAMNNF